MPLQEEIDFSAVKLTQSSHVPEMSLKRFALSYFRFADIFSFRPSGESSDDSQPSVNHAKRYSSFLSSSLEFLHRPTGL